MRLMNLLPQIDLFNLKLKECKEQEKKKSGKINSLKEVLSWPVLQKDRHL